MNKRLLPSKQDNPAEWYTTVIKLADMADYGPVKGTMIFKPYGYAIWENVQEAMNKQMKAYGVGNAYFPLFIPMSLIEKEAAHVEGFSPELAVVTHGGGEELEEPLAIRPTSETVMYESYAKWIQSWRDLPLMMNQWNNIVRWEKRTYLFLRTSEFLWQEGHTAHATHKEAKETQQWAMDMYADIYRSYFALDGYIGEKSEAEKFAGADSTITYEALMPNGKALQSCTSHDLGQNFSKAMGINFQAQDGTEQQVWQTSWGLSTRSIGGLILVHGDDNGLRLPPKLAPVQIIVLPIRSDDEKLVTYAHEVATQLQEIGIRAEVDDRDGESMGWKINKWEVKGAPIRIEIGPREVENRQLTYVKRIDNENSKNSLNLADLKQLNQVLDDIQASMLKESTDFLKSNTHEAKDLDEFKKLMSEGKGMIKVWWNDDPETEAAIQKETKATSRLRLADSQGEGKDFYTGKPAKYQWYFAQSY